MTNTTQKPAPCGTSDNYWNAAGDYSKGDKGTGNMSMPFNKKGLNMIKGCTGPAAPLTKYKTP